MKLPVHFKLFSFLYVLITIIQIPAVTPLLSQFQFSAASVLPTYTRANGDVMVILGKEAYGKDKNTYDDFGGKKDRAETHPELTAARECFEELILEKTAHTTLRALRKHINVNTGNTDYIIARKSKKSVVYITDFSKYWNNIRKKFSAARRNARNSKYKEKSQLVVTQWHTLEKAIAQSQPGQAIMVQAYLVKNDGSYSNNPINIPLRQIFVAKLRPFFQNQPFTQGRTQKIRFYQ
jgi:capsular polysaccharide biosynthesis protein